MSVVVPFAGRRPDAERALRSLRALDLRLGDELVVADNTAHGVAAEIARRPVRVVRATKERSSYHARNVGAAAAANDWLLFIDADCTPERGLLDAYFAAPIARGCGAISGAFVGDPSQRSLSARYARARRFLSADGGLLGADAAPAGNLLVRREAFELLGGFAEGIRSGGDIDFARRLRASGWLTEHRASARVVHRHHETLPGLFRMIARYGAGSRWLNARYPGSSPRWPLRAGLTGAARDVAALAFRGEGEAVVFRAIDGLGLAAHNLGYLVSNRVSRR